MTLCCGKLSQSSSPEQTEDGSVPELRTAYGSPFVSVTAENLLSGGSASAAGADQRLIRPAIRPAGEQIAFSPLRRPFGSTAKEIQPPALVKRSVRVYRLPPWGGGLDGRCKPTKEHP
jgi:hypothetical protein